MYPCDYGNYGGYAAPRAYMQQPYVQQTQAEKADPNAHVTQIAMMHERQPRGFVDRESLGSPEAHEPRTRRSGRGRGRRDPLDELRERMARMNMMRGSLSDRKGNYARETRHELRDDYEDHRGTRRDDHDEEDSEDETYGRL